jgi:hypothetical protein
MRLRKTTGESSNAGEFHCYVATGQIEITLGDTTMRQPKRKFLATDNTNKFLKFE